MCIKTACYKKLKAESLYQHKIEPYRLFYFLVTGKSIDNIMTAPTHIG